MAGLTFEMYVQEDLNDTQLELLSGQIELSLENGSVYQLKHPSTLPVRCNLLVKSQLSFPCFFFKYSVEVWWLQSVMFLFNVCCFYQLKSVRIFERISFCCIFFILGRLQASKPVLSTASIVD